MAFSPDGKRIASGSYDGTVKVWDASTGQETSDPARAHGSVGSVAFSPDGKRIASGSHDGTVKVWDASTGQETLTLQGHTAASYGKRRLQSRREADREWIGGQDGEGLGRVHGPGDLDPARAHGSDLERRLQSRRQADREWIGVTRR